MAAIREIENAPPHLFEDVQAHFSTCYNTFVTKFKPSTTGLDNSVYFIHSDHSPQPTFVFKIIETRAIEIVMLGIKISMRIPEFTSVNYLRSINDDLITTFHGRPAFVMTYIEGHHFQVRNPAEDIPRVATFLAKFHGINETGQGRGSRNEANSMLDETARFWSPKVQDDLQIFFPLRYRFYLRAIRILDLYVRRDLESIMSHWPSIYGMAHGDLNSGNLIDSQNRLQLIDFDGTSETGFQLYDLLQLAARTPIGESESTTDTFIKAYMATYKNIQLHRVSFEVLRKSFQAWKLVFILKAMLATDYYTLDVGKHKVHYSQKNATPMLLKLQEGYEKMSMNVNLPRLQMPQTFRAQKILIAITGAMTSGRSTLAAALSLKYPGSTILPVMTTRTPRPEDDPRFITQVGETTFTRASLWIKQGSYGISFADVKRFLSSQSKVAICIAGLGQMTQIGSTCPHNTRPLRVLLRYKTKIAKERAVLESMMMSQLPSGKKQRRELNTALQHTSKFFFNKNFLAKHIDVVLHRTLTVEEWTQVVMMHADHFLAD